MAQVMLLTGPRASVRFVDGSIQSIPSEPLRKLGLVEGGMFHMTITRRGKDVIDVRVELPKETRPVIAGRPMPKVMMRNGLKMTTRR